MRGGPGLVFGYEEALGYCVDPDAVRDKDGMAAAVVACDLAAGLKAAGRACTTALDELAVAHGVHLTTGVSLRMEPTAPGRGDGPAAVGTAGRLDGRDDRPRTCCGCAGRASGW